MIPKEGHNVIDAFLPHWHGRHTEQVKGFQHKPCDPDVFQLFRSKASERFIPYSRAMMESFFAIQPNRQSQNFAGGARNWIWNHLEKGDSISVDDLEHYKDGKRKAEAVALGGNPIWLFADKNGKPIEWNGMYKVVAIYAGKGSSVYRNGWDPEKYNGQTVPQLFHKFSYVCDERENWSTHFRDVYSPITSTLMDPKTGLGYWWIEKRFVTLGVFLGPPPKLEAPPPPTYQDIINGFARAFGKGLLGTAPSYIFMILKLGLSWLWADRDAVYTGPWLEEMNLTPCQFNRLQAAFTGKPIPDCEYVDPPSELWTMTKVPSGNQKMKLWGESQKGQTGKWDYGLEDDKSVIGWYVEGDKFEFVDWRGDLGGFFPDYFIRIVPRSEAVKIRIVERGPLAQTNSPPHHYADEILDRPQLEGWVERKLIERTLPA